MKAVLVINCFILVAFARFGGAPDPLVGLFTGDERLFELYAAATSDFYTEGEFIGD